MKLSYFLLAAMMIAFGFGVLGCAPAVSSGQSDALMRGQVSPMMSDRSGSGRDRPRIPGGSGCDDPGDIIEHPECRR